MCLKDINCLKYELMYKLKPGSIKHAYNIFGNSKTLKELISYEVELENTRQKQRENKKKQRECKGEEFNCKVNQIKNNNKTDRKDYYIETDEGYALKYLNKYDFTPEERHRVAVVGEHRLDNIIKITDRINEKIALINREFETSSIQKLNRIIAEINKETRDIKKTWGLEKSELCKIGNFDIDKLNSKKDKLNEYSALSIAMHSLLGSKYNTISEIRSILKEQIDNGVIKKIIKELKKYSINIKISLDDSVVELSKKLDTIRRLYYIIESDKLLYDEVRVEKIHRVYVTDKSKGAMSWRRSKLLEENKTESQALITKEKIGTKKYNELLQLLGVSSSELGFYTLITSYMKYNLAFIIGTMIKFNTKKTTMNREVREKYYGASIVETGASILKQIGVE